MLALGRLYEVDSNAGAGYLFDSAGDEMDDLERLAREIMRKREPRLEEWFVQIVLFLADNPDLATTFRGKMAPVFGSPEYLERIARRYIDGMKSRPLPKPQTVPDPALAVVMEYGYDVDSGELDSQINGHRWAMVAENVVGDLLERYIYSQLGDDDWIWCAGEVVKHIDFIRKARRPGVKWESLQIKNRDNSENSSSSKIRAGTDIQKWHRTRSKTGQTRWDEFPVGPVDISLSEVGFQKFIVEYIRDLPKEQN